MVNTIVNTLFIIQFEYLTIYTESYKISYDKSHSLKKKFFILYEI